MAGRPRLIHDLARRLPPTIQEPLRRARRPRDVLSKPSFRFKLEEAKRRVPLMQSLGVQDPFHHYSGKLEDYARADRLGVGHPALHATVADPAKLGWDDLPDAMILKPQWGSFHRGVFALVKRSDGRYDEILRDQVLSKDEILAELERERASGKISIQVMVEELVLRPGGRDVAYDWKLYTFHDRVGLLMQRDLRRSADPEQWVLKCYSRELEDLGPVMVGRRHDVSLPPPRDGAALIAAAERLSVDLESPFIRVDLFESDRGPLLGELSNLPGGNQVLTTEVDLELGKLWERSETLLRVRARDRQSG